MIPPWDGVASAGAKRLKEHVITRLRSLITSDHDDHVAHSLSW
jgi:hypothetical protein